MKNIHIRIYLKLFILFFIVFFLSNYAAKLFYNHPGEWVESILVGLVSGIFVSAIVGSLHMRTLRKVVSDNINFDKFQIKHSNTITLLAYENELINFLKERLRNRKWHLIQESESEDETVLKFRSPMKWKSWGEIVYVRLFTGWQSRLNLEITSIPIVSTTLIDYGKNKNNVDMISKMIKANFSVDDNEL
jgi:ascorbate-specific PTS system EIIC-type component UlaA